MAIDKATGLEKVVHICTSETCEAHMYQDGNILRCNLCGNTTTLKGWERAQQPVPVELSPVNPQMATA